MLGKFPIQSFTKSCRKDRFHGFLQDLVRRDVAECSSPVLFRARLQKLQIHSHIKRGR